MADDGYTASELRKRYNKGGSASDSDLSAAQLRARYAIPNNTFKDHPPSSTSSLMIILGVCLVLAVGAGAYFFLLHPN